MAEVPRKLVVRTYAPVRRMLTTAGGVLFGVFALYFTYELGRFDAGYDRLAVYQERAEAEVAIERLEKSNRELRLKLAELETVRIGRAREQAEVARTIGDLQAQVARQAQELAFYRGIVTQGNSTLGVKIQQLRIARTEEPTRFRVKLTIVQVMRPEDTLTGTVTMSVEGESEGRAATLDLTALSGGKLAELPFSFRFFESFDQEIELPQGFRPARLTIEVRGKRKGVTPLTQTFLWRVDAL